MSHGAALHLAAQRVEFKGDELALGAVGDEDVARGDPAHHHVGPESLAALRQLLHDLLVCGDTDALLVGEPDLTARLLQCGAVDVVLDAVARDHDVAYGEMFGQAARDARVDHDLGLKEVDHDLGADGGVHLADAALQQHHVLVKDLAADERKTRFFGGLGVFHQRLQPVHLDFQRTNNTNHTVISFPRAAQSPCAARRLFCIRSPPDSVGWRSRR